jgi:hypothetical protein
MDQKEEPMHTFGTRDRKQLAIQLQNKLDTILEEAEEESFYVSIHKKTNVDKEFWMARREPAEFTFLTSSNCYKYVKLFDDYKKLASEILHELYYNDFNYFMQSLCDYQKDVLFLYSFYYEEIYKIPEFILNESVLNRKKSYKKLFENKSIYDVNFEDVKLCFLLFENHKTLKIYNNIFKH